MGLWRSFVEPAYKEVRGAVKDVYSDTVGAVKDIYSDVTSSDTGKLALVIAAIYMGMPPEIAASATEAELVAAGATEGVAALGGAEAAASMTAAEAAAAGAAAGTSAGATAAGTNLFADMAITGNAAELAGYGTGAGAGATAAGTAEALSGLDLGGVGASPNSFAGAGTYSAVPAAVNGLTAAGGASLLDTAAKYATPLAIAGSSILGTVAAKDAANTQAKSAADANALLYKMYGESKALQEPYRAAGVTAQNRLMDVLGLSGNTGAAGYGSATKDFAPSDLTTDPSYQFRLNEGLKALDRQAAARGGLISGGAIKAAQEYGQQSASQEYQNAFNRYQTNRSNLLQPLGNLVSSGQNAAANVGSAAGSYGTNAANNITSAGAANAAGSMGAANAISGGVNQYLNYTQGNNLAELLLKQRQSAYGA
jgi:hypothetical protein